MCEKLLIDWHLFIILALLVFLTIDSIID